MTQELGRHAEETIAQGSKSFAAAARLFDPATRRGAMMLYAWCRHCDDVVDGQVLGQGRVVADAGPQARLAALERDTARVYAGERVEDPAFAALAEVVARHAIPQRLPFDHLAGFRMDVEERRYETIGDVLDYCYGVAGVVGVMMARVMGVEDEAVLDRACDLGLAFQLTNICRDVIEDAAIGRVYLPQDWLAAESIAPGTIAEPANRPALARVVARVLELADRYYASADQGIAALPPRSAWAIATARGVYSEIGRRVVARGPGAWDSRTSTSKLDKIGHVARGGFAAVSSRGARAHPRPADLWTRPR